MRWGSRANRVAARATIAALAIAASCGGNESVARVTVPTGASMRVAAESLHRAAVIGSPGAFRTYAKLRRSDRGIKAGTYMLRRDASWESVLTSLREGRGIVTTVLVPEGFTLAQTEPLLAAKLGVPLDSVRAAVRDTTLLRRLGVPTATLEGYLFPDTYLFSPGTTARAAVLAMVRRFEQRWNPAWNPRLDSMRISRHQLLTMASIVEREAKLPKERPTIAGVYWNRMRRGMLLQADPTVQYALPDYQSRLMNRHLTVKSPYNTYVHKGLPPGPIGAPGAASIQATLYSATVPYLYFVAYPDGHHEFRNTLAEHQTAARAARRAWTAVAAAQRTKQPPAPSGTAARTAAPRGGAKTP
jgi:UPF0755 protein